MVQTDCNNRSCRIDTRCIFQRFPCVQTDEKITANLYSGYKFSVGIDLKLITRYFGIIFVGVLAVSSVVMAVKKERNKNAVYMGTDDSVPVYVPFNSDTRTTTFAFIHSVTYNAYTYINKTYNKKNGLWSEISLLALVHSVNVYIPRTQPHNIQEIKHMALIPNFSMLLYQETIRTKFCVKEKNRHNRYDGDTLGRTCVIVYA